MKLPYARPIGQESFTNDKTLTRKERRLSNGNEDPNPQCENKPINGRQTEDTTPEQHRQTEDTTQFQFQFSQCGEPDGFFLLHKQARIQGCLPFDKFEPDSHYNLRVRFIANLDTNHAGESPDS